MREPVTMATSPKLMMSRLGIVSSFVRYLIIIMLVVATSLILLQEEVEDQILNIYRLNSERINDESSPVLHRDKHASFLRKGLIGLSDAYEVYKVPRLICHGVLRNGKKFYGEISDSL